MTYLMLLSASQPSDTKLVATKPKPRPAPVNIPSDFTDGDELSPKEDQSTLEDDNNSDLENLNGKSLWHQLFSEMNERDIAEAMVEDKQDSASLNREVPVSLQKHVRIKLDDLRFCGSAKFMSEVSLALAHTIILWTLWHPMMKMIPIISPAHILGVKNQLTPMRAVIKAAIKQVTSDIIFATAYPAVDITSFTTYHCHALVEGARSLGYNHLVKRFKKDSELLKLTAAVVDHSCQFHYTVNSQTLHIHTHFKEMTDSKIEGFYLSVTTPTDMTA
ncbi:hypothetical protein BDN71DRAFT_1433455 [Pleurotus eryngii]|uniref:Uncharacterized protein n=1 Tax=Pleurotus eryngii TaxID=5323 RepID=A0A9P5ZT13_PLEER|nr:hypothetical protein BDN71DRAFT_1433455 [Pleurotus eryngii]